MAMFFEIVLYLSCQLKLHASITESFKDYCSRNPSQTYEQCMVNAPRLDQLLKAPQGGDWFVPLTSMASDKVRGECRDSAVYFYNPLPKSIGPWIF